jgi:hypothetical protein
MEDHSSSRSHPVVTPKSAIGKHFGPFGCHVDLAPDEKPDDCVLNYGAPGDCMYARGPTGRDRRYPHTCKYWRPVGGGAQSGDHEEPHAGNSGTNKETDQ